MKLTTTLLAAAMTMATYVNADMIQVHSRSIFLISITMPQTQSLAA